MKLTILPALLLCTVLSAAEINVNGAFEGRTWQGLPKGWGFNNWSGFRPNPKVTVENGILHVHTIPGKSGCGLNSPVFAVSPGGKVILSANVSGKGKGNARLHFMDDKKGWLGLSTSVEFPLESTVQKIQLTLPVYNIKPGKVSAFSQLMIGAGNGNEFSIQDLKAEFVPGTYVAGKGTLPAVWKLFAPVPKEFVPAEKELLSVPASFNGVKPTPFAGNGTVFDMLPVFKKQKVNNCAWLFGELYSPRVSEFTIGAGADWWITVYVNGKKVIDTSKEGNVFNKIAMTNHTGTAVLKKGMNTVAVKFVSGSGSSVFHIGGPDDFAEKEDFKIAVSAFEDDFERPRKRPGSPEIVSGILSPGLLTETKQGVYRGKAVLIPEQKVNIPESLNDARFAAGFRLYELQGKLNLDMGKAVLQLSGSGNGAEAVLKTGSKVLLKHTVAKKSLPVDVTFAVDKNGKSVLTFRSLADSTRKDLKTTVPLPKTMTLRLENGSVKVDQLSAGLALPKGKRKQFPLAIVPDRTFNPVKAGWKLVFSDEFNGKELDRKKWDCTTPDYVSLDGKGNLVITTKFDKKHELKSGGIRSVKGFRYGWFEARLKFTRQQGWWAAFWLYGKGHNPMIDGIEIDIFEDYFTRKAKPGEDMLLDHNLHVTAGGAGKSWNYPSTLKASEIDRFHTIACKRTPFEISLYLDGKLISSRAEHSSYNGVVFDPVLHSGGTAPLDVIFSGQIMTANKWGHSWSDYNKGKFPEEFIVDHCRVYEYPAESAPSVQWKNTSAGTLKLYRPGAEFTFEAKADPSKVTEAPVKEVYLMDSGAMIAYLAKPPYRFKVAVNDLYYGNTPFMMPGRNNEEPSLSGLHTYSIMARDKNGMGGWAMPLVEVLIVPDKPTSPYLGKAQQIPGILNPAAYDEGGNGVAYLDDKGNFFNRKGKPQFREGEDVDAAGHTIGRIKAGEWLKYTVQVAEAGKYKAVLKCGTPCQVPGQKLYMFIDGKPEPVAVFPVVPHKASHFGCDTLSVQEVELPAGKCRLVLVPDGMYNFSDIEFTKLK